MDKIKTQDCYLPVDVNERLPEVNGYYITWDSKLLEKGLIHYHRHTGWQNGFYNDSVTHWLERHENMIVLTESEYLADKKKTAEAAFDAGWSNGHSAGADIDKWTSHPDKGTYINTLSK